MSSFHGGFVLAMSVWLVGHVCHIGQDDSLEEHRLASESGEGPVTT